MLVDLELDVRRYELLELATIEQVEVLLTREEIETDCAVEASIDRRWQVVNQWQRRVQLDGIPAIRRRHEGAASNSKHFGEKGALRIATADVLDHRATERDIESIVLERQRLTAMNLYVARLREQLIVGLRRLETTCRNLIEVWVTRLEEVPPHFIGVTIDADVDDRLLWRWRKQVDKPLVDSLLLASQNALPPTSGQCLLPVVRGRVLFASHRAKIHE